MSRLDDSCRVPFHQGKIAWQCGDHQKAEAIWLQMLEEYSDDWLAFANMADAMACACRYDEAIRYYKRAQELQPSPKYTDAQRTAAHIYEIQGRYAEAIESLNEGLEILKREWNMTEGREVEHIQKEIDRLRRAASHGTICSVHCHEQLLKLCRAA